MKERLLALLLAGALVAPRAGLATERTLDDGGTRQTGREFSEKLPLPPTPYLDTIPWLKWQSGTDGMKVDTLFAPSFNPWGNGPLWTPAVKQS